MEKMVSKEECFTKNSKGHSALSGVLMLVSFFFLMYIFAAVISVAVQSIYTDGGRSVLLAQTAIQTVLLFGVPPILTILMMHRKGMWREVGISVGASAKNIAYAIIIFLLMLPAMNYVIYLNSEIVLPWQELENTLRAWERMAETSTSTLLNTGSIGGLISGVLIIGAVTGFCEELFFRGMLQRLMILGRVNCHVAVWTAAFIFSLAHMQFYGFFPRLFLGAFLGYLLLWSGSLWLPVIVHAVNNSLIVIFSWIHMRFGLNVDVDKLGVGDGVPYLAIASALTVLVLLVLWNKASHKKYQK